MNIIPASYIIYKDGPTIKAVNGTTGTVDYNDHNAATVINSAISALSSGGKVYIKAGEYTINSTIFYKKDNVTIEGDGHGTLLKLANNANVDILSAGRRDNWGVIIRDLKINGNKANNTSGRGLVFTGYVSKIDNIFIRDCASNGFEAEAGITKNSSMFDCFVSNIRTTNCNGTGFLWGSQSPGGDSDNYLQNILSWNNGGDGIDLSAAAIYGWNLNSYNNIQGHGIIIRGAYTKIHVGVADGNGKNGFWIQKTGGWQTVIIDARSRHNSKSSAGTYHAFYIDGDGVATTSRCTLIGCHAWDEQYIKTQGWGVTENYITSISRNMVIGGSFTDNLVGAINVSTTLRAIGINAPYFQNNVLSDTFAIDLTGIKTVTIAHSLAITPAVQDCYLTVIENTAVDDWTYNMLKIVSTDAKNVTVKINISTASATVGATAKLALRVGNP